MLYFITIANIIGYCSGCHANKAYNPDQNYESNMNIPDQNYERNLEGQYSATFLTKIIISETQGSSFFFSIVLNSYNS